MNINEQIPWSRFFLQLITVIWSRNDPKILWHSTVHCCVRKNRSLGHFPELDKWSPRQRCLLIRVLMFAHLLLGFPSGLFPRCLLTKFLTFFLNLVTVEILYTKMSYAVQSGGWTPNVRQPHSVFLCNVGTRLHGVITQTPENVNLRGVENIFYHCNGPRSVTLNGVGIWWLKTRSVRE
jgi:hypothetical protein